jgi:hypothetical protein
MYPVGTFERPRPDADFGGKQPPKPRNFLQGVVNHLNEKSRSSGLRHRIDAEDAINHGVEADSIYIKPKAKHPVVKLHLQRVFATSKGRSSRGLSR